ncbi:recombinase family protein [Pseudoflavonifractor phocaeensis]|uniref:recombinase family protein n=1 Tax=Pseudoflavonifractor phocaeensis TaxID=1870988 RepID=UPI00195B7948|nr:recombinase family protein [Pseudoflavonifractor phocaeensis]MBM6939430.1 recombinase family protein [Pseudoflavonifractor phocaeensis]
MDLYDARCAINGGRSIFELPMRVTYYARVSTEKDAQLHSLSAQVDYYRDLIGRCPVWTGVEGYVDEGISGTSAGKREQFLRMIDDAKAGRFDFILTKEISRFSRSTLDSIRYTQELLASGVGVYFQSDNINTLLPDAELRLTIMASIAQDEVRKISERVKFGCKRAIEKGVVLGNSRIWGYEKAGGRLVVRAEEAEMVRLIFDWYANRGMGIRAIARRLWEEGWRSAGGKELSFSTIRGILTNPKYKGYYCGGKSSKYDYRRTARKQLPPEAWTLYRDEERVPAIVSEALWDKAQAVLQRRTGSQRRAGRYAYSGKLFCAVHGTPYYRAFYRTPDGGREVWQCQRYARAGKKGCEVPMVYSYELDELCRQLLLALLPDGGALGGALLGRYERRREGEKEARCRAALAEVARRKDKLLDLSVAGLISDGEFFTRNQGFNRELEALEAQLARLEEDPVPDRTGLGAAVERALAFPEGLPPEVADALLERVEVCPRAEEAIRLEMGVRPLEGGVVGHILRRRGKASLCSVQYI